MDSRSIVALSLSLLLWTSALAQEAPVAGATGQTEKGKASEELPKIQIQCVRILDRELMVIDKGMAKADLPIGKDQVLKDVEPPVVPPCDAPGKGTLIGTGDVIVIVSREDYDKVVDYEDKNNVLASLYVNGVFLGTDAKRVGTERYPNSVALRYNIVPGENSKTLWSSLYRTGATTATHRMSAALGFGLTPIAYSMWNDGIYIAITNRLSFGFALFFIAALVAFAVYLGTVTDVFRDVKTPDGGSVRATFSLGRIQLAMWFLFAVATGVFLLTIYGDLPAIDNSILGLLGLSVGVTGVSLAIDSDNPQVKFKPSGGFFRDMVTSWDDKHQVYRFQAVIVNLLLLVVGIIHVMRHLTYPIFDSTWLAFLGVSGIALTGGKKFAETEPAEEKVADAKPAETEPAEEKPDETKP